MAKKDMDSEIILYQTEDGQTRLEVRLQDETVWLSLNQLAVLFQRDKSVISRHVHNIYSEKELSPETTVAKFATVQHEGARSISRNIEFYNLDMIISVGYRVKSHVATRFRQWATRQLREFLVKGFLLDDERLKNPDREFDYYDELIRRIQDIRTSERRFYQKITDIYATSVDYDPTQDMSILFFKTVQNKMHWAISGMTAAELIYNRADSNKENMGLTSWRGTKVRKDDVSIAKNYLSEEELLALNNLVEQYLVFAEGQAMRRVPMYMQDWIKKLDGFMTLNERNILSHAGKISHELAMQHAEKEYEKFNRERIARTDANESDFEKKVREIESKKQQPKRKRLKGPET